MQAHSPHIDRILFEEVVAAEVAPAAAACVATQVSGRWVFLEGAAGVHSRTRPYHTTPRSIFDLASVTKPIFATVLVRLSHRFGLELSDELQHWLPETAGSAAGRATVELLLAHRAGLEAHLELFLPLARGQRFERARALEQAAHSLRSECRGEIPSVGFPPRYSDLGYMLLGAGVEAVAGAPLDELIDRELLELGLEELGSARILRERCEAFNRRVVPTETVEYRTGEVVGKVHDDNAWALSGEGIAGHAGAFGTAIDVARFGCWLLERFPSGKDRGSDDALELLLRRRPGSSLRAGFDGKGEAGSSIGTRLGPETFGHLGFTGTSLWCDPRSRLAVVLLTNRVCPSRDNTRIRQARPRVHDALVQAAESWKARSTSES